MVTVKSVGPLFLLIKCFLTDHIMAMEVYSSWMMGILLFTAMAVITTLEMS